MSTIRKILKEMNTPTDYKDDWYSWVVHHWAHTGLGTYVAAFVSDLYFVVLGEYPDKWVVIVQAMVVFTLYQCLFQKDRDNDMINDIAYFTFGLLLAFSRFDEVTPGSDHLDVDMPIFWMVAIVWLVSFVPGIKRRIKYRRSLDVHE